MNRLRKYIIILFTAAVFGLVVLAATLPLELHQCEVLPVADRQRVFYKLGYLEYDGIDRICGSKTHFAQKLYEHDWEAVKIWKARPSDPNEAV